MGIYESPAGQKMKAGHGVRGRQISLHGGRGKAMEEKHDVQVGDSSSLIEECEEIDDALMR